MTSTACAGDVLRLTFDEWSPCGSGLPDGRCRPCRNARNVELARRRYATDTEFRARRQRACRALYWADPDVWRLKQRGRYQAKAAVRIGAPVLP